MRLIDADVLLKVIDIERKYLIARGQIGAEHILVHYLRKLLANAPTVDAVEVVRCKDCVHYKDSSYNLITDHDMVCAYAPLHHFYRESNDYCSKGERKEQK